MIPTRVAFKVLAALCVLASTAQAASPKTLSAPSLIPSAFSLQGLADAITPYTFTLHLPSKDDAGLASWLDANAGNAVLTPDQLGQYVAPTDANLSAVQAFLKAQGIADSAVSYNAYKNEVNVASTVGQAAKLFAANFSNYKLGDGTVQRTKQYVVPADIADAVDFISPFTSFIQPKAVAALPTFEETLEERAAPSAANCNTAGVTPQCLRQYYGTISATPKAVDGINDIFVAGFIGQNFAQSDLTAFLRKYRPDAASAKVQVINRAGALNLGLALLDGAEAMLDTETTVSATYPLKSVYFNYGTMASQGDIFQKAMADIVANYAKYGKPGVYTISYGSDENTVTAQEATTMCNTARQLTALGTTVLVASGDNGVGGQAGDKCPAFVPTYPSGCQYILSVGATQGFAPEVAVDTALAGFYSGAGFSSLYPRPSYQNAAVAGYTPPASAKGQYNVNGRAYPDVSAQGSKYAIQYMGAAATVGGTSASTPTWASVIALINDLRRKAGKANVGWVNPKLYNNRSGTKDITGGSALGCSGAPTAGFNAAGGWDPASGLGTPLFDQLRGVFGV